MAHLQLDAQYFRLHVLQWTSVHLDQTTAIFTVRNRRRSFLQMKDSCKTGIT